MTIRSQDYFSRQISVPSIGKEGLRKLQESSVAIIGAGGVGSAAAYYQIGEHTSELQSLRHLVCRLLLEKKKKNPSLATREKEPARGQWALIECPGDASEIVDLRHAPRWRGDHRSRSPGGQDSPRSCQS